MQFGRIHGMALIVLGLVLIALQVDFAFGLSRRNEMKPPPQTTPASGPVQSQPSHLGPLPGVVGAASVLGGFVVLATARRRDQPPPEHMVK